MDQTLDTVAHLDKRTERHQLGDPTVDELVDGVAVCEDLPRIGLGRLERQRDALFGEVHVEDFDVDFVTDGNHLTRVVNVLPAEFRNVNESVHATQVHEGTEVDDRRDDAVAALAGLEVGQKVATLLLLGLFEPGATREHDVITVAVELDDLGLDGLSDVRLQLAYTTQLDQRRWQEPAKTDVHDEATLDDLDDDALDDLVARLQLFDVAPSLFVLGALLRKDQTTFLVFLLQDQALDTLAERDDIRGVGIVADREFTSGDDAFRLESDVQKDFVVVDFYDRARHEVTVVELEDAIAHECGEVGANHVVFGDDARHVVAVCVKGAHLLGGEEAQAFRHRYFFHHDHTGVR